MMLLRKGRRMDQDEASISTAPDQEHVLNGLISTAEPNMQVHETEDSTQGSSSKHDNFALSSIQREERQLATSSMPITASMLTSTASADSPSKIEHEAGASEDGDKEEAVGQSARAEPESRPSEAEPSGPGPGSPRPAGEAGETPPSSRANANSAGANPYQAKGFAKPSTMMSAPEPMQAFTSYLRAEVETVEKLPTSGVVWGQSDRDSVYNFLLLVPYQLERLMQFSLLLCLDAFLGVMTLLPLRCVLVSAALASNRLRQHLPGRRSQQQRQQAPRLGGGQVFDMVCLLILVSTTIALRAVRPAFIYFWLRDATNEFLKMSVLVAAVEMADTILGDFGLKVLQALSGTCTLWGLGRMSSRQLACDSVVALVMVLVHALTLMCQALLLSIALNSKRHGLLALLIGSNFYEIKGSVFKRWDQERIRKLACMDSVERFQLISILVFVVVEDMDSSASFQPNLCILWELVRILGAEMVIDVVKHAVISRFNDVRPGIYREYMKDLCDKVVRSQSHTLHTLIRFPHLACCALYLRSAVTLFWLRLDAKASWQVVLRVMAMLGAWTALLLVKAVLGYCLKLLAHMYVQYYNRVHGKTSSRPSYTGKRGSETAGFDPRSKQE